jgi:hypothetical protein
MEASISTVDLIACRDSSALAANKRPNRSFTGSSRFAVWHSFAQVLRKCRMRHFRRYAECQIMPNHLCISGQESFFVTADAA